MMSARNMNLSQNALKQSKDYIHLGKKESALEILYEAIRVRRGKTWNASIHEAMESFLKLCLTLKSVAAFRDGVTQFKILCQTNNVNAFETLLDSFIDQCIENCQKAQETSREKLLAEDLDEIETPETIMLKSITETTSQDRTDRIHLLPIVKFTWEILRTLLDVIKNNQNLEKFYSFVCDKTFKFLNNFGRKIEFRKLCDHTRSHLTNVLKYSHNNLAINLLDSTSSEIQLEMRLNQLDSAITMELWNEAFKTMEDIHFLLRMSNKHPHPKILAIFYQKISLVFAKSNEPLFHAIALQKLFTLIKEHKKNLKPEDLIKISSKVVIASLSIPLQYERSSFDILLNPNSPNSTAMQLGSMLGLHSTPSRSEVVAAVENMLTFAEPSVENIYRAINSPISPANLCKLIDLEISSFSEILVADLTPYIDSIRKIAFLKMFKSLSQVYRNIPIQSIVKYSCFYNEAQVLSCLLEASRQRLLEFRIDGQRKLVDFQCTQHFNIGNKSIEILNIVDFVFKYAAVVENKTSIVDFVKSFWDSPNVEFERYNAIESDLSLFLEKVAKADQENAKRIEENMMLGEENAVNKETDLESENKELNADVSKDKTQDVGSLGSSMVNEAVKTPKVNEIKIPEREINAKVNMIKKVEKMVETFKFAKISDEREPIKEYIAKDVEIRKESWNRREKEYVEAFERLKKEEANTKARLTEAGKDLIGFKSECKSIAEKNHNSLLDQYNEMIEKERKLIYQKIKEAYIKKKKLEHVAELKRKFLMEYQPDKKLSALNTATPPKSKKYVPQSRVNTMDTTKNDVKGITINKEAEKPTETKKYVPKSKLKANPELVNLNNMAAKPPLSKSKHSTLDTGLVGFTSPTSKPPISKTQVPNVTATNPVSEVPATAKYVPKRRLTKPM